ARGGEQINETYGYNYGVYLNFPTVNGMLIKNQIKEARSLYDREIANAQITKNNIYLEIQQAYLMLYEKKNQLPVAFLQVKQAKENYDLSFGRYKVGVGNPTELKDAQNSYQSAQLNYYKALYEYNSAKAKLEKAIGKNIIADDDESIDLET
ncbi:MAG TPA: TolC family protein, partial [Candidatus Gastranaerophilaceae bacterium]|nr:TolC family protein [Candidatus Gastranaerophilaceae bacterium]